MPQSRLRRTRQELSAFLRHARDRLKPEEVGLPRGHRRRAPGLRREEVAALAGVGVSWYTWLEQGRAIRPSPSLLERLAEVLRLAPRERQHLFHLAGLEGPPPAACEEVQAVGDMARRLVEDLGRRPAFVLDARWDVLLWNRAAARLYAFAGRPNLIRLLFTDRGLRDRLEEWEVQVAGMLGSFQRDFARDAENDPAMRTLVDELRHESAAFRCCWERYRVAAECRGRRRYRLEGLGSVSFDHMTLVLDERRRQRLVVYEADTSEAAGRAFEAEIAEFGS
ncbi:helix-turn-helix transcriptional regulator [Halomonas koreensis]|uniref:Helix-turn-helix transcriptional regulator n=1 Tax=Halomonas koreensis TaxID=245385 RepID=A0ABU1G0N6_9GAMM|nr:helix-turn-helix transcriptional regulator [Halomonas koreensis]MDR5866504.1 helix-turn-helix transcriptional regulator [Halomonas koreensis]